MSKINNIVIWNCDCNYIFNDSWFTISQCRTSDCLWILMIKDPGPGFGTDKLGTFTIDANNNTLDVSANLTVTPKQDKVFEGWLVYVMVQTIN